jgi:hypothetical protein
VLRSHGICVDWCCVAGAREGEGAGIFEVCGQALWLCDLVIGAGGAVNNRAVMVNLLIQRITWGTVETDEATAVAVISRAGCGR